MKSDSVLLSRLQSGDQAAWAEFYNEWVQPLYNFIRSNGIYEADDAADVLGDTWLAAPRAIANFDGQNATLKTFIYSLARRKIADYWRKHKPIEELPETIASFDSPHHGIELREILATLPDQERQVLILRYLEGFSVKEIAETLGRTYKGTESLLSRSRKRLEEEIRRSNSLG